VEEVRQPVDKKEEKGIIFEHLIVQEAVLQPFSPKRATGEMFEVKFVLFLHLTNDQISTERNTFCNVPNMHIHY
jgi:hypothetical protein